MSSQKKEGIGAADKQGQQLSVGNNSASTTTTTSSQDGPVTPDELLALVQAIKFAKPEASQTKVHKEITTELSQKEGFSYLSRVKIKDVKKAFQRHNDKNRNDHHNHQSMHGTTNVPTPSNSNDVTSSTSNNGNADLLARLQDQKQVPQLYTVGDGSKQVPPSLSPIAQLANQLAAAAIAASNSSEGSNGNADGAAAVNMEEYIHVFWNVPMDRSGSKPHQALINFQQKQTNQPANSKLRGKGKGKGKLKKASSATVSSATDELDENGRFIVKIQQAAPISPEDNTQFPMLVYNHDRSRRTFLHPSAEYDLVVPWMQSQGQEGVLGNAGGSKAYFFARNTISTTKGSEDIVSIDITQVAPTPNW